MISATVRHGKTRVFDNVNDAVAAAVEAQLAFERKGFDARGLAIECIRKICVEQAEPLGKEEFAETKIGRLDHKIEKLVVCGVNRSLSIVMLKEVGQPLSSGSTCPGIPRRVGFTQLKLAECTPITQ